MSNNSSKKNETIKRKSNMTPFSFDQYEKLMEGFSSKSLISKPWKKRGENYVQYSAFDDSLTCVSSNCII